MATKSLNYVRTPYTHPGFPDIDIDGPVEIFRKNAKEMLDEASFELDRHVQTLRVKNGPQGSQLRKRRNAVRAKKSRDSNIDFEFFFDRAAYETLSREIRDNLASHFDSFVGDIVLEKARKDASDKISNMERRFKGKLSPTKPADGDFYEKIAKSLEFTKGDVGTRQPNQFTHYSAGSFDDSGKLSGVTGSRGANLIELIGMGPFPMETSPFGGTKRLGKGTVYQIMGNLKGQ